jgi:hypothetical protein
VYERKFTYTSATHTSTVAYAGNVGKRKNNKRKNAETNSKGCQNIASNGWGGRFLFLNRIF